MKNINEFSNPVDKWGSPNVGGPGAKPYGSTNVPSVKLDRKKKKPKRKKFDRFDKKSKEILSALQAQASSDLAIHGHSRSPFKGNHSSERFPISRHG